MVVVLFSIPFRILFIIMANQNQEYKSNKKHHCIGGLKCIQCNINHPRSEQKKRINKSYRRKQKQTIKENE